MLRQSEVSTAESGRMTSGNVAVTNINMTSLHNAHTVASVATVKALHYMSGKETVPPSTRPAITVAGFTTWRPYVAAKTSREQLPHLVRVRVLSSTLSARSSAMNGVGTQSHLTTTLTTTSTTAGHGSHPSLSHTSTSLPRYDRRTIRPWGSSLPLPGLKQQYCPPWLIQAVRVAWPA